MTILTTILAAAPNSFGTLNTVILVSGLLVLTAAAIADWRIPQEQISKDRG